MTELQANYGDRLAKCLATRDRTTAAAMLREVQAAVASRSATGPGWADDMVKLAEVAGVSLTKAAPGRPEPLQKSVQSPALPPHLDALAKDAVARIEAAGTKLEKDDAMRHGRDVAQRLDDFWQGFNAQAVIGATQARPPSRKAHL